MIRHNHPRVADLLVHLQSLYKINVAFVREDLYKSRRDVLEGCGSGGEGARFANARSSRKGAMYGVAQLSAWASRRTSFFAGITASDATVVQRAGYPWCSAGDSDADALIERVRRSSEPLMRVFG